MARDDWHKDTDIGRDRDRDRRYADRDLRMHGHDDRYDRHDHDHGHVAEHRGGRDTERSARTEYPYGRDMGGPGRDFGRAYEGRYGRHLGRSMRDFDSDHERYGRGFEDRYGEINRHDYARAGERYERAMSRDQRNMDRETGMRQYTRDMGGHDRDMDRHDRGMSGYDRGIARYDRDMDRYDRDMGRYDRGMGGYPRDMDRHDRGMGAYPRDMDRHDHDLDRYTSGYHGGYGRDMSERDRPLGDYGRRAGRGFESGPDRYGPGSYGPYEARGRHHDEDEGFFGRIGRGIRDMFGGESHRGRGPKNYQRSDERIRDDLYQILVHAPYIDASDVELHVDNGEVRLTGFVNNRRDKRRIEDLADEVLGVKDVHNELRVRREEHHEDLTKGTRMNVDDTRPTT